MSRKTRITCSILIVVVGVGGVVWWDKLRPVDLVPVTGRVTFHGEPLSMGFVMSRPVSGGQAALAALDGDGRFALETNGVPGAAVGLHRLVVNAMSRDMPPKPLVPAEFFDSRTTPLTMIVRRSGENHFEFDISNSQTQ